MNGTSSQQPVPATIVVTADTVLEHALAPRVRRLDGAVVISHRDDALELDGAAADLYLAVDGSSTVAQIAARVAEDYDADPDTVLADAMALFEDLANAGLVGS